MPRMIIIIRLELKMIMIVIINMCEILVKVIDIWWYKMRGFINEKIIFGDEGFNVIILTQNGGIFVKIVFSNELIFNLHENEGEKERNRKKWIRVNFF